MSIMQLPLQEILDRLQVNEMERDEYDELVSIMTGKLIKNFDGKKLPAIIEFIPLDKDGNKTIIERIVWKFDIVINKRLFMPNYMRNLK